MEELFRHHQSDGPISGGVVRHQQSDGPISGGAVLGTIKLMYLLVEELFWAPSN